MRIILATMAMKTMVIPIVVAKQGMIMAMMMVIKHIMRMLIMTMTITWAMMIVGGIMILTMTTTKRILAIES